MQKVPFVPTDKTAGLMNLLEPSREKDYGLEAYTRRKKMTSHPFGLDFPEWKNDPLQGDRYWAFVGVGSRESVLYVAGTLRSMMGSFGTYYAPSMVRRLRIFNVQCSPKWPERHFCYFEIWTKIGVIFSGDCTNHSGAGSSANRDMRSIFSLLSSVYRIGVEEYEISYEESRDVHSLGLVTT